jgi:hypothetical protein
MSDTCKNTVKQVPLSPIINYTNCNHYKDIDIKYSDPFDIEYSEYSDDTEDDDEEYEENAEMYEKRIEANVACIRDNLYINN